MANGTAPFHIFQFATRRVSYYLNDVDPDVPEGVLLLGQQVRHRGAMAALPIQADNRVRARPLPSDAGEAPRTPSRMHRVFAQRVAELDADAWQSETQALLPARARRGMARGTPKRAARWHVWFEKVWDDDD